MAEYSEERAQKSDSACLPEDEEQNLTPPPETHHADAEMAVWRKLRADEGEAETTVKFQATLTSRLRRLLRSGWIEAIIYVGIMVLFWLLSNPACWDR